MDMHKILILFFSLWATICSAQEWQWSVPVKNAEREGCTAYLWIPENAKQVRGIVLGQSNMQEISILESPVFRNEMRRLKFAIIWVAPFFDHLFRFNEGADIVLNDFMAQLAAESGYSELNYVPLVTMGHSAAASWPYYYAACHPERTLCALSVSGQWPYFRDKNFAPDIWGDRNIDYIPALETMGEYESAVDWSREGLKERKEHPYMPLSMLSCPGEGHFATTEKKVKYLCLYIRKAVKYRYPRNYDGKTSARLKPINPTKTGWLMERWNPDVKTHFKPAPVGAYKGDATQAFWFFDREMAYATQAYQHYSKKERQLVGIQQDGMIVPQRNSHLQLHIPFKPQDDGITFYLKGVFYDSVPGGSPRPQIWTGKVPGTPIGHSPDVQKISIERITGPFSKLNDTTFVLALRNGENGNKKNYSLTFIVTHPGDDKYAPGLQQAEMLIPSLNVEGESQVISFPKVNEVKTKEKSILLKAFSSSGLPVYYYVESGPAYIRKNRLIFTKVPPRAKWPVKIHIVAWQYGRKGEKPIQTANPIRQTVYLVK